MTTQTAPEGTRIRRLWSGRLWILAAVLGATTVYTGVMTVHDGARTGSALALITQATAMHLSTLASARLERLALEAFAPVGPLAASTPASSTGRATIDLLAHRQREGEACACRELLRISRFYHVDATTGQLAIVSVDTAGRASAGDTAVVAELLRGESQSPRGASNASSRLVVDRRLGDQSVVSLVQRDDRGAALAVYGMLVDTRETLAAVFARPCAPFRDRFRRAHASRLLVPRSDSAGGERLFGDARLWPGAGHRPLGGSVARPAGLRSPSIRVASRRHCWYRTLGLRLWNLGALLAATIVVLAIALGASRRELQLARARSDFIAGVSHDLRMPLAQILIASETLSMQRERTDGERVSLASSIVRETRRLVALVDNVLLFSRSGAVELKPALRPVSVTDLLGDVTDAVQLAVEDAGQTIEIAPAPATTVMADRRLARQALVNLVDNALKYGAPGQRIRLGAEANGSTVRLYVEDEGPGIPAAERDRIFQPYARLAHDQSSERTGTGLGLAVVRQIAVACGGRVWLEDAPRRGARAVIELRSASVPAPFPATPEIA